MRTHVVRRTLHRLRAASGPNDEHRPEVRDTGGVTRIPTYADVLDRVRGLVRS